MTDTFRQATGRKVVSRSSAAELGVIAHLLVDTERWAIGAIVVGKGRKALLVDWAQVSGFGPAAVMVNDENALRAPADDREHLAAAGRLDVIGRRVLTDAGNELGVVDDVTFDPDTGVLGVLRVAEREIPASSFLGSGVYAAVVVSPE